MLKALIRPAFRGISILTQNQPKVSQSEILRKFSQLSFKPAATQLPSLKAPSILSQPLINQLQVTQNRTFTKYSFGKGKRRSIHEVIYRFKRLDWGIWIRTKAGRKKRMWKKSPGARYRARQHVFTNSTQSWMLDKMVCKFWRRPKYYIDDPYAPYHKREMFPHTRTKPIEW